MTCVLADGCRTWGGSRDANGRRTYTVEWTVRADSTDGPWNVMNTPGLPVPGAPWVIKSDVDIWCWCTPEMSVVSVGGEGEYTFIWRVQQKFQTVSPSRGPDGGSGGPGGGGGAQRARDQANPIEDPLLEPPDISFSDNNRTEEITHDRFGFPIMTSSWEPVRGPQVEFDKNRGSIRIRQNVQSFFQGVVLPARMRNRVNDRPLWGFAARHLKLSSTPCERKYYGYGEIYYARTLEFEYDNDGFDRNLLDEGTKVLHGRWASDGSWELIDIDGAPPDPFNPRHFDQFKDKNGENCRIILNGNGLPSGIIQPVPRSSIPAPYVCIDNGALAIEPTNGAVWVQQTGEGVFDDGETYDRGFVVTIPDDDTNGHAGEIYIALFDDTPGDNYPPFFPGSWVFLSDGITDKGNYSATVVYLLGDRVWFPAQPQVNGEEPTGSIFVQHYREVNFLFLGIPALLG